ncbi:hypothetical protein AC623_09935 [Bacillus sp. FJAT-27231]|uniref:Hsp20/alpha crystallin family protein n=1 Tax=Bacillus sp. FJAT-27231 TaxID=1679168 RepID=UPI000670E686|nr:Hsp20/alpha crystallin family protein [Bacillus sp. FJAT-27231]KMY54213.1 hypothetical protein AC623_09935 [Bacillus sp. FJAT-27231]
MVQPHFRSNVKDVLGKDFSELLYEIAPFVEPRIDIFQSDHYFMISVEIAGARHDDISVKRQQNTLLIEGTIPNRHIEENIKVINSERFYGPFKRSVSVPKTCALERLDAVLQRGVLWITIPFHSNADDNEIKIFEENSHDIN